MEIKRLTQYRSCWMGFAIIWIVLYHSQLNTNNQIFMIFQNLGLGGTDIFLFCSGLGCYCSLTNDPNSMHFLKKRFMNLMPTYWCFIIIWIAFKKQTSGISFFDAMGNIFCIEMLINSENCFNWYISAIWILYLISPYLKEIVDKSESWLSYMATFLIVFFVSVPLWNNSILLIFFSRIPVFFIGMCVGKLYRKNFILKPIHIAAVLIGMIFGCILLACFYFYCPGLLIRYGFIWYPFILIAPGICMVISLLLVSIESTIAGKTIKNVLSHIGDNTFEIYLIHLFTIENVFRYLSASGNCNLDSSTLKFLCLAAVVPGTWLLKNTTNCLMPVLRKTAMIVFCKPQTEKRECE